VGGKKSAWEPKAGKIGILSRGIGLINNEGPGEDRLSEKKSDERRGRKLGGSGGRAEEKNTYRFLGHEERWNEEKETPRWVGHKRKGG